MYKSIVFAVTLYLFLTVSIAEDDITIYNMIPANGAVVNDCPSFSWSQRPRIKHFTITVYKDGESTPVINDQVTVPQYKINPLKFSTLLEVGNYKWNVTTNNGDRSPTQSFSVNVLSCLPPKLENRVDNSFATFNQLDSHTASSPPLVTSPWKAKLRQAMSVNGVNISLTAPESENIYTLELHETYVKDATSNPADETVHSVATSNQLTPTVGDNFLSFRYIFFSTGNSTIHIELQESGDNIIYLGCVGATNTTMPCQPTAKDMHGTLYSTGIRVLDESHKAKWDVFSASIEPRVNTKPLTIRLRYERELRQKDDGIPSAHANFLFTVSEFVFGQCSSIPDIYYNPDETRESLGNVCPKCDSAGMRCPKEYYDSEHCFSCDEASAGAENCSSVSYCSYCSTTGNDHICQAVSKAECKNEVNCSQKTSKGACTTDDYCEWCELDGVCSFRYNDKSVCSTCDLFSDKTICNAKSSCKWCSTLHLCLDKQGTTCPSCDIISKDSCTFEDTDGSCQYCNNQSKCLNTEKECTSVCATLDKVSCNNNVDCHWCVSAQSCLEQRVFCSDCESLPTSDCAKYPGCHLCETMYCTSNPSSCPVCDGRTRETCDFEGDVPIYCQFCNSTQECKLKNLDCKKCEDVAEAGDCNALAGCSYCKSEQVCKNFGEAVTECDCLGLSAASCTTHTKGCCWSKTDSKCYDIGDEKCENPLDTTYIIIIASAAAVFVATAAILIPVLVCCCKPKKKEDVELQAPATIVVLPEGQPSMVVGQESLNSVNVDPATAVSVDETTTAGAGMNASTSMQDMQNMQNMIAQQQMLNTMMAQQQMSMMMNPMMINSMNMMNMSNMAGMNSMGMDMNSMNMTGGMMNSMNMTGGMNSMNMTGGGNSMNMAGDGSSMNMASGANPMNMTGGMSSMQMQSNVPSSQGPM